MYKKIINLNKSNIYPLLLSLDNNNGNNLMVPTKLLESDYEVSNAYRKYRSYGENVAFLATVYTLLKFDLRQSESAIFQFNDDVERFSRSIDDLSDDASNPIAIERRFMLDYLIDRDPKTYFRLGAQNRLSDCMSKNLGLAMALRSKGFNVGFMSSFMLNSGKNDLLEHMYLSVNTGLGNLPVDATHQIFTYGVIDNNRRFFPGNYIHKSNSGDMSGSMFLSEVVSNLSDALYSGYTSYSENDLQNIIRNHEKALSINGTNIGVRFLLAKTYHVYAHSLADDSAKQHEYYRKAKETYEKVMKAIPGEGKVPNVLISQITQLYQMVTDSLK